MLMLGWGLPYHEPCTPLGQTKAAATARPTLTCVDPVEANLLHERNCALKLLLSLACSIAQRSSSSRAAGTDGDQGVYLGF